MSLDLFGKQKREEKRTILQGVYKDNLDIDQLRERKPPSDSAPIEEALPPRRATAPWRAYVAVALCMVVLAVAGAAFWQRGAPNQPKHARRAVDPALATPRSVQSAAPYRSNLGRIGPLPADRGAALAGLSPAASAGSLGVAPGLAGVDVPLARLFGLSVRTIVIDPGHGGDETGAVGPGGTMEKTVTLDVARRLRRRLEGHGYRVLMTREGDEDVSLQDRVAFANTHAADLFISVHINALPVERVRSVETYYFGQPADGPSLRIAERENRYADLTVSAFNDLMENTRSTLRLQESKELATSIQKNLYRNIRKINRDVSDWGVKTAPFVVLLGVEAPSVLAEIAVITNRAEEAQLGRSAHRENLAMFLEQGIADYLNARSGAHEALASEPGAAPSSSTQ